MNVLSALVWIALTGEFTPANLALGFGVGYLALWSARRALPETAYFGKVFQVAGFGLFFLWELVKANLRVAYDILTPSHHMKPAVVAVPLELTDERAIVLLAILITLTPGTLGLDVSTDHRVLYVHAMYVEDLDEFRASIKEGFEKRVVEIMR